MHWRALRRRGAGAIPKGPTIDPKPAPPIGLILAAGLGRRLGDRTADRPKALLELRGRTLLERLLTSLAAANVAEAVVVTGHGADRVDAFLADGDFGLKVRTVFNPDYATANNIVSFLSATDAIADGCLLLNSDIVVDPSVIADLAADRLGSWLVVDHDEPLGAEEMKVQLDGAGRIARVNKELPPAECVGRVHWRSALRLLGRPGMPGIGPAARGRRWHQPLLRARHRCRDG